MKRRVKKGMTILWPTGEIRAESGQVFDDLVEQDDYALSVRFQQMISPFASLLENVVDDAEITASAMPEVMERELKAAGYAGKKKRVAKKAAKKDTLEKKAEA